MRSSAALAALVIALTHASVCLADKLPTPNSCTANSTGPGQITFSWIPVAGGVSYDISRDGVLLGSFSSTTLPTKWVDSPPAGTHVYCVVAQAPGYTASDPCCATSPYAFPPDTPTCRATNDPSGHVLFQWQSVQGASSYVVSRDGQVIYHAPANVTSYVDPDLVGIATYCVHAVGAFGSSDSCCAQARSTDGMEGQWRLSWGTCSPQVSNQDFHGPDVYSLDLSFTGISSPNVGHDTNITIRPSVPDAWRFDVAGCQTLDGIGAVSSALGKSCPAMIGTHPLSILAYNIDPSGSATLRLACTYDTFTPDPSKRYVVWKISFNHQYSVLGSDADPNTCDGAGLKLEFFAWPSILLASNRTVAPTPEPLDMPVTWNGDTPVRTQVTTWGRLKSLYR